VGGGGGGGGGRAGRVGGVAAAVVEKVEGEKERRREEGRGTEYFPSLSSARDLALDKDFFKNLKIYFAESQIVGTRQRRLYRVLAGQALDKDLF
jgi:hypothetical protein